MDIIKIQVRFQIEELNDALYYDSWEDYQNALNDGSHEAEKKRRLENWKESIKNPPVPVEPTKEEYEALKTELLNQVAEVQAKIDTK